MVVEREPDECLHGGDFAGSEHRRSRLFQFQLALAPARCGVFRKGDQCGRLLSIYLSSYDIFESTPTLLS